MSFKIVIQWAAVQALKQFQETSVMTWPKKLHQGQMCGKYFEKF